MEQTVLYVGSMPSDQGVAYLERLLQTGWQQLSVDVTVTTGQELKL